MSDYNLRQGQQIVPPPPVKKSHTWLWVLAGALVLVVVMLCGIMAAGDPKSTVTPQDTGKVPQKAGTPSKQVGPYIGEGEWLVGTDVAPGTYRTSGAVDDAYPACAWVVRKDDDQNSPVIDVGASDKVNAPGRVVLKKGQVFETSGCKGWVKQ